MQALMTFFEDPSEATFLEARVALMESGSYAPYSTDLDDAEVQLDAGDLEGARATILNGFPNLLMSPKAHLLLAFIAHNTGDTTALNAELAMADLLGRGILSSGDGTRDQPYRVLRISDEYDALEMLQKAPAEQSLIDAGDRSFDRLVCTDESELWFEITDIRAQLARSRDVSAID